MLNATLPKYPTIFSQKITLKTEMPMQGGYSDNRYADTKIFG